MKKRVLIDANPAVPYLSYGKNSGIGRTCMELISELDSMRQLLPFDVCLYTQNLRGVSAKGLDTGFETSHAYLRNNERWNRVAATMHVREILTRYDLQHITHNFEIVNDPSRCIVTIHDAMFFSYPEAFLGAEYNRRTIPGFARKAAAIITISNNSKREIMEYMGVPDEKITVIPWGVDHKLLYPHNVSANRWTGNSPYFISVSCDIGRKNSISVLRAYERFVVNNPRHHLLMVWRSPSEEARGLAAKPHIQGRIHFASNIPNDELANLYAGATASFFPSLYEGFGLPIVESMACGVPCVTCRNSSLEEVGGDAAIYVDPFDIDAMANEMEQFENGRPDFETLQAKSVDQASKFTWHNCAEQTIRVYEQNL